MIPVDISSGIMLIELLCSSRSGLDALRKTIDCIEHQRIELAYQKQVNLETNEVTGIEALLRLQDGEGGYLPNDEIIPQIEGESLFSLVVLESLVQLEKFFAIKEEIGFKDATLYLNVSAHTIMHPEFCSIFTDFVEKHNLAPNQFGLEVTETAELADINIASESLQTLKDQGIKIALDDFGVERSNIQRLQHYPIDIVKLDRSLIMDIEASEKARKMVGSLAVLLKSLELDVTVEGIETEEQAQILNNFGLTIHQGYLYSKPVPPNELELNGPKKLDSF